MTIQETNGALQAMNHLFAAIKKADFAPEITLKLSDIFVEEMQTIVKETTL